MTTTLESPRRTVGFQVHDVTHSYELDIEGVASATPAAAVAQSVAASMELPTTVPWALRSNRTGSWLNDELPIGEQLDDDPAATYTLTPKAHLGAYAA